MALIEWKEHYSVGVAAVDHEHRELIDLINRLHEDLVAGSREAEVSAFLGDILRATPPDALALRLTHLRLLEDGTLCLHAGDQTPRADAAGDFLSSRSSVLSGLGVAPAEAWRYAPKHTAWWPHVSVGMAFDNRIGLPRQLRHPHGDALEVELDRPIEVLPNGVDPARFTPGPEPGGPFTVGFVGTLKPWHGVDVLVRAVALLDEVRLRVIGDGPEREALERLAVRLLGAHRADFVGAVPPGQLPAELARLHVAVAPYPVADTYFSPLKVFEYLAAGLPVVASRSGQLSQLLAEAICCVILVPPIARSLRAGWVGTEMREQLTFGLALVPGAMAAFTLATSPRQTTVSMPPPMGMVLTMPTLAALAIASVASTLPVKPLVSIMPIASLILNWVLMVES